MNKCARCGKTVYPTEELKCLDKLWHKVCFKCDECGMALSMKNYKGFNKIPYCNTHYPHMKPTNVTETPESRRLAENTRLQSQVKYHEDFERAKGKVTQVADDPETVRILNAHRIISNVAYHGDLERKKQMEEKRVLVSLGGNTTASGQDTNGHKVDPQRQDRPAAVPQSHPAPVPTLVAAPSAGIKFAGAAAVVPQETMKQPLPQRQVRQGGEYETRKVMQAGNSACDPNDNRAHMPHKSQQQQEIRQTVDNTAFARNPAAAVHSSGPKAPSALQSSSRKVGSITDYDPLNENYGSIACGFRDPEPTFAYFGPGAQNMEQQQLANMHQQQQQQIKEQQLYYLQQRQLQQQQQQQQQQQIQRQQQMYQQQQLHQQKMQSQHLQQQHMQQQLHQQQLLQQQQQLLNNQKQQMQQQQSQQFAYQAPVGVHQGVAFSVRAMYDYKALDDDEVSFMDGDLIIGCVPIDDGWMTGTVQRTGQRGMLPSNYVEVAP